MKVHCCQADLAVYGLPWCDACPCFDVDGSVACLISRVRRGGGQGHGEANDGLGGGCCVDLNIVDNISRCQSRVRCSRKGAESYGTDAAHSRSRNGRSSLEKPLPMETDSFVTAVWAALSPVGFFCLIVKAAAYTKNEKENRLGRGIMERATRTPAPAPFRVMRTILRSDSRGCTFFI